MPHVKSLTDVTIRTTIGHTIQVPANTPTYIPPDVVKFAKQMGLAECDEQGNVTLNEEGMARETAKRQSKEPPVFTTLGSPVTRYGPTVQAKPDEGSPVVIDEGLPPDPGLNLDNTFNNTNPPNTPAPQAEEIPQLTGQDRDNPKRREEAVRKAVERIYREGNPDDFTVADHRPKVRAVEQLLGFSPSGQELQAAVDRHVSDEAKGKRS